MGRGQSRRAWVWLGSALWAVAAYGGGCSGGLASRVADVNIEQESALVALLHFGAANHICLAVEAPGLNLLRRPVRIHASRPAVAYVIQTLLDGTAYQISESDGVILIRNADTMGRMTQLDVVVPDYKIPEFSVDWAVFAVFTRLMRLADPSLQAIGGDFSNRLPNNTVGPMEELGRTARELLTLIISKSTGGAWVSGQCLGPVASRACWTVIQYRDDPEILASMVGNLARELSVERLKPVEH